MELVLAVLLALAVAGLISVAIFAIQARAKSANLNTNFVALQTRHELETKQLNELTTGLKNKCHGLIEKYNSDVKKWNEYTSAVKAENQRLTKWKGVANAEVKAEEMLSAARAMLEKAKADSEKLIAAADERATALRADAEQKTAADLATAADAAAAIASEAKDKAKSLKDGAQALLDSATTQAANIVAAADAKAKEIAGSAYEAMKNASLYEHTVKSMRNIIEGYGNQYIIPPHSLLDDLADNFGYAEAGQKLKQARERAKVMVRNGTAAACEYVEANRHETAISFVIDAFNGKVDSVLSRVKHDNAGRLEQEVRDAFNLVNFGGKAFRDARITDEYLAARLDELKWAAVVQQLALQEREEQRHAKEQAREEARAAKERERALRDAAKEEEMLRRAMDEARQQFEQASGEQKSMYEERLQEMGERLKQALERKERARSMAEQTKKGYVYIISNVGSFGDDVYKIGLTRRFDPRDRVDELGGASVPFGFDVHAMILAEDAPALERRLHRHFALKQVNKVNHRKEFFRVSITEVHNEIAKLGINGVNWTMTAQAKEYYETLATEKKLQDDPAERERWVKRQVDLELRADDVLEPVGALADEE